jgi:hypothetical protein
MLARHLRTSAPRLARSCSFQAQIKEMEAKATKLAPSLPDSLREIAEQGPGITAELTAFAKERPELYQSVLSAIKEADLPGIKPTVLVAKDPSACKYTEEGTMVHDMMKRVAKADRRVKLINEIEYTLTAADKEEIKATMAEKAAELGIELPATVNVPSTTKVSIGA